MYKPVFEVIVAVIFLYTLYHSRKKNLLAFASFGFLFGLMLEILTVVLTDRYSYGIFVLSIYEIPLAIAMSWSMIIYAGYTITRNMKDKMLLRSIVSAYFGLHLDLIFDVIAIRVEFWDWGDTQDYFGVPFGNFLAWFVVIFSYTYFYEYLSTKYTTNSWINAASAFIIGLVIVNVNNFVMLTLRENIEILNFTYLILIFGITIYYTIKNQKVLKVDFGEIQPMVVTLFFHSFFTATALVEGIFMEIPLVIPVHIIMLGLYYFLNIRLKAGEQKFRELIYLLVSVAAFSILFMLA